ncbi:lysozyme inhibitor LprI family protein, partial [Azotobacter chroococcum]|nr:lysozyme inhibitor LprI family protein [Azotobacter chroococcum]
MKKFSYFLAVNFLAFSLPINAGQQENNFCERVSSSQQIFECSIIEREKADQLLNNVYHELMKRIVRQYKTDSELKDAYTQKIKESQRLWLRLRDADCTLETFEIEAGTQAYETTFNKCVARSSIE